MTSPTADDQSNDERSGIERSGIDRRLDGFGAAGKRALLAIAHGAPEFVLLLDRNFEIVWINNAARDLTGWAVEDVAGRSGLEFVHPDDLESVVEYLALPMGYRPGGPGTTEPARFRPVRARLLHKDGRWIPIEAVGNAFEEDLDIDGTVVLMRDARFEDAMDRVVDLLAIGAGRERVCRAIVAVAEEQLSGAEVEVHSAEEEADRAAEIDSSGERLAPWEVAMARQEVVVMPLDDHPVHRTSWSLPLVDMDGSALGALFVRTPQVGPPSLPTATLLQRVARIATLALQRLRRDEQLQRAADHDALTGLLNRRAFYRWVDRRRFDGEGPFGVFAIDLDGFKQVNDDLGHAAGDELLRVVADRLRGLVRPGDMVARLGGDEFVVICGGVSTEAEWTALAARFAGVIARPVDVGPAPAVVEASIGVGVAATAADLRVVLEAADHELVRLKRDRR